MLKVLFVCLGNICRSPMAEAVMRYKISEQGLTEEISVDSAGTSDWHIGQVPHEGTRQKLDEKQITYEGMHCRQIDVKDFDAFDYIIVMDTSNLENVKKLKPNANNVYKLMSFLTNPEKVDVPDPYFTGDFEETYSLVNNACQALLLYMIEKHGISPRRKKNE